MSDVDFYQTLENIMKLAKDSFVLGYYLGAKDGVLKKVKTTKQIEEEWTNRSSTP